MITIVIAQDERKTREMLGEFVRHEKDRVIELGDSLYAGQKGALYKTILAEIEKPLIEYVLERTEGNQLKASRVLGINRNTMRAKIRKLSIDVSRWKP